MKSGSLTGLPVLAHDVNTRGNVRSARLREAKVIRRAAVKRVQKKKEHEKKSLSCYQKSEHAVNLRDLISPLTVISHEVARHFIKWVTTTADTF